MWREKKRPAGGGARVQTVKAPGFSLLIRQESEHCPCHKGVIAMRHFSLKKALLQHSCTAVLLCWTLHRRAVTPTECFTGYAAAGVQASWLLHA